MAYTFQRRQELAREKGFGSYSAYRRAVHDANTDVDFLTDIGEAGGRNGEHLKEAKAFSEFRHLKPKEQNKEYGPKGKVTAWFVDTLHKYTADEWAKLYPKGVRTRKRYRPGKGRR